MWRRDSLICVDGTSEASDKILPASCSADISSESNPTTPPSTAPSVTSCRCQFLKDLAILKAMLGAKDVLPIDGRPARISKSEG